MAGNIAAALPDTGVLGSMPRPVGLLSEYCKQVRRQLNMQFLP